MAVTRCSGWRMYSLIVVIVDILKALSNSFFEQVACLLCGVAVTN